MFTLLCTVSSTTVFSINVLTSFLHGYSATLAAKLIIQLELSWVEVTRLVSFVHVLSALTVLNTTIWWWQIVIDELQWMIYSHKNIRVSEEIRCIAALTFPVWTSKRKQNKKATSAGSYLAPTGSIMPVVRMVLGFIVHTTLVSCRDDEFPFESRPTNPANW